MYIKSAGCEQIAIICAATKMISNGIKVILVLSILLPAVVPSQPPVSVPETTRAVSVMSGPTDVKGVIVFESLGHDWIRVTGSITGLQPGPHGFHVHELGDLTNGTAILT